MEQSSNFNKVVYQRLQAKDFAQSAEPTPRPAVIAILIIILCILVVMK